MKGESKMDKGRWRRPSWPALKNLDMAMGFDGSGF
jgi:hypothetical protein